MTSNAETHNRTGRWLRRMARGLGTLVAAFWLFITVLSAVGGSEPWTIESSLMMTLIVASTVGVIVAWWRAGLGGTILVLVGVAHMVFAYFAAGHNKGFAMLISGGPFLLVGVLFLLYWNYSHRDKRLSG